MSEQLKDVSEYIDKEIFPAIKRSGEKIGKTAYPAAKTGLTGAIAWLFKHGTIGISSFVAGSVITGQSGGDDFIVTFILIYVATVAILTGLYERKLKSLIRATRETISRIATEKDRYFLIQTLKLRKKLQDEYEAKLTHLNDSYKGLMEDRIAQLRKMARDESKADFDIALTAMQDELLTRLEDQTTRVPAEQMFRERVRKSSKRK